MALFTCVGLARADARVSVTRLRCEYRVDPEGIGETRPRLGWTLEADPVARGVRQTAYQILVASAEALLARDRGDLWDSGRVASDQMHQIPFAGKALHSRQQCFWKARVWDEGGRRSEWSAPARFSVGLLAPSDWTAQWIGLDAEPPQDGSALDDAGRTRLSRQPWIYADLPESKTEPLTAYVRGTFAVTPERLVTHAALAVTVDQTAEIAVNGRPLGMVTRWEQMAPLDITDLLAAQENVVALTITQRDGYQPAALGEVEIQFADGTNQVVAIDTSWVFATEPSDGWDKPGFDARSWRATVAPPAKRNPWNGPPQTLTYWLPPVPQLRKTFEVTQPVRRATLYSTALGAYELHLNGARVGQDVLTPGWTEFRARVHHQTYDVTALVHPGPNALGALLGDGWYASVLGYTGRRYFYGGYPRFLAQLEIEQVDGTRTTIATDDTWRAAFGPIRQADLMQGSIYDAHLRQDGWANAGFDDAFWHPVATGLRPIDPQTPLTPFVIEPATADAARVTDELPARTVSEPRAGAYTFDFGQNLVGWVRLKLRGKPSQKIMVRHGEMLNPNGTLYTSNLRGANATDIYYLRGDGLETLEPAFTFHGFRYAEITGLDEQPEPGVATAVVVHSAMERTGDFESSSALLNQLFRNVVWGQRGNYVEVPTDCPQRDERAGWTGDAQFFARTATYNFDVAAFLSRWLATLTRDAQLPSGAFANVAPMFGSPWAAAGWGGDAVIITTHTLYRVYDDTRIIERSFAAMDKYMAWLTSDKKDDGMRLRPLGDHLNLGGGAKNEVIAAAYRAQLAELMAEMAAAIGRTADSARYRALHDTTRAAFARDFILPDGSILDSSQTGYALAFTMGLVPEALREKCAQKYFETLRERDFHLATGFIGTPRLLPGLHLAGRDDVAYRVLLQETHPSWLFQVRNGATTIWERWDGWTPENGFQTIAMNSFNHYAFGSVAEYLYRHVAGLDLEAPGFRKVRIQPVIESGLTSAQASYQSISGRIASAWKLDGERLTLTVEVPPNTEATVLVPARDAQAVMEGGLPVAQAKGVTLLRSEGGTLAFRVGSGHYEFVSSRAPTTVAGHASTAVVAPSRSRSPAWRGLSASRAATEVRSANRQADEIQLLRAKDLVARPAELIDPDAYND